MAACFRFLNSLMSVDGPPGFQLLRLGFCAWASCESPSNPPRPWGRACSLSLTTTVYSSMWASRSCGSLDNHPPLFLHSRARSSANLAQWLDPALHLPNAGKQSRANLAYKRGGSMRVPRPSLSGVLRSPAVLLLLTSIVPVSVLAQECT